MGKPNSTQADFLEGNRQIGLRLAYFRKRETERIQITTGKTQVAFCKILGISREHLANIESGRSPLKLGLAWRVCKLLDVHPNYLLTELKRLPFPPPSTALDRVSEMVNSFADTPFLSAWPNLAWMLDEETSVFAKTGLTNSSDIGTMPAMKFEAASLLDLLNRVKKLTSTRGKPAQLAESLGVERSRISEWLSGKTKPDGENTLKLLHWVQQQGG